MLKRSTRLGAAVLFLMMTKAGYAQKVPGGSPTDWTREREEYTVDVLRAYNQLMTEWRNAWEHGDAKTVSSFYTDGAILFLPESEPIQGKELIGAFFEKSLPPVEIRTGLSDFVASDRLVYALGPYWSQIRDSSGQVRAVTGTCVTILVREGKRWKIRSQIFRLPTPGATGG